MSSPQDRSGDASVDGSPFNSRPPFQTPTSHYREEEEQEEALSITIPPIRIPPSKIFNPKKRTLKGKVTFREDVGVKKPTLGSERMWYEFRGRVVPPAAGGRIGDVFWDITPPFVLYVRRPSTIPNGDPQWIPWNPDAYKTQLLAEHPLFINRYLLISGTTCNWVSKENLRNNGIDVRKEYALDEASQDALTLPKEVASESPRCLENTAGQSSNLDGSSKRKRSDEDEDDSGRHLRPPQVLDDIPQACTVFDQCITPWLDTAASTNALLPTIHQLVSDQTRVLAGSAVEVGRLRVENEQLRLTIAAKDTTIGDLQTRIVAKEKEVVTVRETLEKELEATKQRVEMIAAENSEIKSFITQLEAKLHHEELINLEARERDNAKIIELQMVGSNFWSSVQSQAAGYLAQFERARDVPMK
ncbi:hypothetical protein C8F04DRAFT_1394085 [Mycena alexandri]|uniref:Uncharacterized protein n=1 Tax=Mycena alexandri TaxID=1745969 RepID=A0AAD6X6L0_9AGAR|nr:hypothetical protein C8F04DRAFT_1394085 [Mycena alexandri]